MDIHKPKPWHGVREFLKEIGTIVIGVLIALGAEQAVEWLHWQEKVHSTERAIRRDFALTADVASERVAIGRCLDGRLDLLKARVKDDRLRSSTALPADADGVPMPYPYRAPSRAWNTQVWDQLKADGTLAHIDPERSRALNLLYLTVQSAYVANHEEKNEATDLQVLEEKGIELTADKKAELVQHIDRLRMLNGELVSLSRQMLRRIDDAGYLPPLKETTSRLGGPYSNAMQCRYAEGDLKGRISKGWFTLHR
jgi:hypothetical protein